MSAHGRYPERARKGYGHNHQKSSDSGVGSSSDQDSYPPTNPDWNHAVRESQALSAAVPAADYHATTIAELHEALSQAHAYIRTLKLQGETSDAEIALKDRTALERDQEYRELYSRFDAIKNEAEVLKEDVKRLTKERIKLAERCAVLEGDAQSLEVENDEFKAENEDLKAANEELKTANEKLGSQKRKLEKKLDAANSAPEDHDTKSPRKESRKKEDKPSSGSAPRESRSRTSADKSGANSSAPRRSESKRRSTTSKSKDVLAEKIERANAKADEIYEEEWGPSAPRPSAPRPRKDSSATITTTSTKRMPPPAITSPRSESASTYSDGSRSSRTDSNVYRRPTDVYVENPYYPTR